ncbi:TLDc domain, partial [Dillenia turbinata]
MGQACSSSSQQTPDTETLKAPLEIQNAFSALSVPRSKFIPLHSLQVSLSHSLSLSLSRRIGKTLTLLFFWVGIQRVFHLTLKDHEITEGPPAALLQSFLWLLENLGSTIVDEFFVVDKRGGVSLSEFVNGHFKCSRTTSSGSKSIICLLRLFALTAEKSDFSLNLKFESVENEEEEEEHEGYKITGWLRPSDMLMFLWMCWVMLFDSVQKRRKVNVGFTDVDHLLSSAMLFCAEQGVSNVWDCDLLSLDVQLPADKVYMWILKTVPFLPDCAGQFFKTRLQNCATAEEELELASSSADVTSLTRSYDAKLLNSGRAWAIYLTLASDALRKELLGACFPSLNRFWSNIEGYYGPLLMLVSASSGDGQESNDSVNRWIIGVLTEKGFENRDQYYGGSGNLYAISPVFHVFPPFGREKNFVYSHLHPTARVYEPHPKPVGIAFGGKVGNERIFIDEDFARITVRHHAGDKTYRPGPLMPNQGFLPLEASILEVEVWGLGGRRAKEVQNSYKKREELFTEQRRKVDLKTFASWEDSPEKMMMDMISDHNSVRREDRS